MCLHFYFWDKKKKKKTTDEITVIWLFFFEHQKSSLSLVCWRDKLFTLSYHWTKQKQTKNAGHIKGKMNEANWSKDKSKSSYSLVGMTWMFLLLLFFFSFFLSGLQFYIHRSFKSKYFLMPQKGKCKKKNNIPFCFTFPIFAIAGTLTLKKGWKKSIIKL